jgi:WD40 repeat protein
MATPPIPYNPSPNSNGA